MCCVSKTKKAIIIAINLVIQGFQGLAMDMDYYGHAHCSGLLGYSLGRGFADARGENQ